MLNIINSIIKNKFNIIQNPSFVTFLVTWRCNSRCVFCDVWKRKPKIEEELNLLEIENIFKQLKKIDILRITGGEPFLRNDLADIINMVDKISRPSMIHITSNGILTDRIIETMKKIKPLKKVHIKISIDNIGEKHDKTRGVAHAYDNAMDTVKELAKLRKMKNFYLGVNQAIVNENEIESFFALKKILKEYDVAVNPLIAYEASDYLYSDKTVIKDNVSFKTFGKFSEKELKRFINILQKHGKEMNNIKEQLVDKYHIKGLYNRLVKKINKPNPKCVALNNHLRILPNGDVPVCLYNSSIVGNLREEKFRDIWFGEKIKAHRNWVKKCPGCWQGCEVSVNAIYTGDIWKGLFY